MVQLARVKYLLLVAAIEGSYTDFPFSTANGPGRVYEDPWLGTASRLWDCK